MARIQPPKRTRIYFFSDVHLGLDTPERERSKERMLLRFLDTIMRDAEQVFIAGDLFDFWFEYRSVIPSGHVRVLGKLAELTDAGVRITFLAGNHDFWLKSFFPKQLGVEVSLEPIERNLYGKRFFLHHGDGLLRNDTGYRMLKSVLRNRVSIFLFSLVHPDITGMIARWSSRTSRQHTGKKTYEGNDMVDFARQKIREGFDVVVMGHNHQPHVERFQNGTYINLGDWIDEHTYAVFDGRRITLKTFRANEKRERRG